MNYYMFMVTTKSCWALVTTNLVLNKRSWPMSFQLNIEMKAFWIFGCDWFCCRCSKATVKGPQTLPRRISTTCSVTTTIPARNVAVPPGRIEFWWGGSHLFTTNHNVSAASYLVGIGHINYESTCIRTVYTYWAHLYWIIDCIDNFMVHWTHNALILYPLYSF